MFELRILNTHQEDYRKHETRKAHTNLFDFYAEHALDDQLRALFDLLDDHPLIPDRVERDLRVPDTAATGAYGLRVDSVFR